MFRLAPMLLLRPVELRTLEWTDVDLDAATIVIPGHKMKSKEPHVVPLPRQAVRILREVEEITGRGRYVFTGGRGMDHPQPSSRLLSNASEKGVEQSCYSSWIPCDVGYVAK